MQSRSSRLDGLFLSLMQEASLPHPLASLRIPASLGRHRTVILRLSAPGSPPSLLYHPRAEGHPVLRSESGLWGSEKFLLTPNSLQWLQLGVYFLGVRPLRKSSLRLLPPPPPSPSALRSPGHAGFGGCRGMTLR